MAYHLLDAKPLPEPMLTYWLLDPCEQTSVNLKQNITISIQWNEFENVVYKMPNIWSQPSCVNFVNCGALPEPMLTYWLLDPCEQTSVNLKQNITISIQWNEFENVVYKMPNIWSQPSCVNFVNCGETKIDCSDGLQELNCDYLWGHMHGSCWWWTILCLYMVGPHDFLRRLVRCICGLIAVW